MANDNNSVNVDGQPSEKWIIDIDEKIFYRHLPRTNDFPLSDSRLVHDMIGDHDFITDLGHYCERPISIDDAEWSQKAICC